MTSTGDTTRPLDPLPPVPAQPPEPAAAHPAPPAPQPYQPQAAPQSPPAYPPQQPYAPQPGAGFQPGAPGAGYAPPVPPKKKRTGLIVAIASICLLTFCCCVPLAVIGLVPAFRDQVTAALDASKTPPASDPSPGGGAAATQPASNEEEQAAIEAGEATVEKFYAAFNAGDLEAIKATLMPNVANEVTADWFDVGTQSTFEYTRGIADGETILIFGRESETAFGSGGDGGVKFTLLKSGADWLITGWAGADRTQIEGSDTTGSSSGVSGELTEEKARGLIGQLLEARRTGNANVVRQLTTEAFQTQNGDIWLDGRDNSEFFLSYNVTSVILRDGSATVTTEETWNSGPEPATYTIVERDGALLVDTWN